MNNGLHRKCWCGSDQPPKIVGSMHDPKRRGFFVICPNCGCRSITETAASRAWYAWDYYDLQEDEENISLYDIMKADETK